MQPTLPAHLAIPSFSDGGFFEPLRGLEGDEGARSILAANADLVRLVRLSSNAARVDLDTPEAWAEWRAGQT